MRRYVYLFPLAALGLLGCSPEKPAEPEAPAATPTAIAHTADDGHNHDSAATPVAPTAPVAPPAGAPMAGATDPYAPLSKTPELDKKIADTQKAGEKAAIATAYAARGMFRMKDDDKAGQRVKYRAALADFRKALSFNAKNSDALVGKDQIESIYTSMGRPVPSEAEADEVSRTGTYKPKVGE